MELHFLDRRLDEAGLVTDDDGLDITGERGCDLGQTSFDGVNDLDRVGSRLLLHDQAHGVLAIETAQPARFFDSVLDTPHIADANRLVVAIGDDEFEEVTRFLQSTHRAQDEFLRPLVHTTSGQFEVLANQSLADVLRRQHVGRQPVGVDVDVNRSTLSPDQCDGSDALHCFQVFLDRLAGNLSHFAEIAAAGNGDGRDGGCIDIKLVDQRRIGPHG